MSKLLIRNALKRCMNSCSVDDANELWEVVSKIASGDLSEGSMADAEKHSTGPEFTGYWKGTDKGRPGKKMVGSN